MRSKCCRAEVFSCKLFTRCLRCSRETETISVSPPSFKAERGKVILATVHGRTEIPNADVQLLAVGKPKGTSYFRFFKHEPGLAPSWDLVTFTKEHNRKGRLDGWFERYTESLIEEWLTREDSLEAFKMLRKNLNSGLNVGVACYCHHKKRDVCHLSILRDIMESMGYEVLEAEPIKYK